jgi:hypothetical protein
MQAHLSISAFPWRWEATYGADASNDMEEAVGQEKVKVIRPALVV